MRHRNVRNRNKALLGGIMLLAAAGMAGCGSSGGGKGGQVIVYNWGEYIDPETIEMFEEETGIEVVYDEFETNEIMYPKVESGASSYDVVCPSDYMISKMIANDMLAEINFDNIPNAKKTSAHSTTSSPKDSIRKINMQFPTAGVRWASSTTRPWWRNRSQAGRSCGMKNMPTTS